ncbi:hypothetical protein H4696_009844 [Amycolatopsis lexingtonensis]|uniref:Guanylate cyclase domain-containing protein n=1 Tax=Amycolatopsis lexingtonensis TaxID=218822 RepID=A0ABR9IHS2_9PSEU|nr:hypothetical protein [Amycolatopsis lexingtonensis]MBE1502744.1 hypothetical protein [Amycolatopsis lexingtonensis]
MTLDIEGFGSKTRTDPIRAGLRRTLEAIVESATSLLHTDEPLVANGDTGDGKWMLFSPNVPKTELIMTLLPGLETRLRHHNSTASSAATIRLRIGVHHGELIKDDAGYSGEALNHAFRIIDNGAARQALRASSTSSVPVFSSDFYDKIIRPGYGSIDPAEFAPIRVENKETSTVVWIKRATQPLDQEFAPPPSLPKADPATSTLGERTRKQVLTISDLPPTSLYVAISDIHNARLYGRGLPEAPVRQHIEAALLLANKIVVHCADPYRSKTVADTITELLPCVEAGDLLFLLGENVEDPTSHFRGYLDYKIDQYGKSRYGSRDVKSLTEVDGDATERTEALINRSPFALIRGFSGADGFIRAARDDLQPGESITIREHYNSSAVSRLSLTLRQLLDLTHLGHDGSLSRTVAHEEAVGALQADVERLAGHFSFSRQILMEALRHGTGLSHNHPLDEVFEERVSLVHLIGTIGPLTHTEVTHRRDRLSPYYYHHLLDHLSLLAEAPLPKTFGSKLVLELRALPGWWHFASHHLRLVADAIHRQVAGERAVDLGNSYRWSRRKPEFEPIRSIVRSHWI